MRQRVERVGPAHLEVSLAHPATRVVAHADLQIAFGQGDLARLFPRQRQDLTPLEEAEGYRQRRVMVSRGEAENFASQMKASAAAPEAYRTRMRMRTLEESLQEPRKIILPRDVTVVIDDAQPLSPDMMEIQKDIAAEVNK